MKVMENNHGLIGKIDMEFLETLCNAQGIVDIEVKHLNADVYFKASAFKDALRIKAGLPPFDPQIELAQGYEKTTDGIYPVLDLIGTIETWFFASCNVIVIVNNGAELVLNNDEEPLLRNKAVLTYDTDNWVYEDDAFHCETDSEWYENDVELVSIDGSWYREDDDDVHWCKHCDNYFVGDYYEVHINSRGDTETWCESCYEDDAFTCDDCGEVWDIDYENHSDCPDRYICDSCRNEYYFYCEECSRIVHYDYYNGDEECCDDCAAERSRYVKEYHWHHNNWYENKGMLFMPKGKMISLGKAGSIRDTIGVELEVNRDDRDTEEETLEKLNSLQSAENEWFYERDGSLSYGGVEIITAVHTFKSIKKMPWKDILETLKKNGYESHDGGKCGLHVHIGRSYFGSTRTSQDWAIGSIYGFYVIFWEDLVKASRRNYFRYCDNPSPDVDVEGFKSLVTKGDKAAKLWAGTKAYERNGSHGLALNNANPNTFEFRLGRGTLKYESLMAWIDLTITIARNSRKASTRKMSDADFWLSGISKETAEYLKSKNAFTESKVIKDLTSEEGEIVCA